MALYPQSTTYTQVPYPTPGYGAAVPPPNPYYAPPAAPQPVFHLDPNTFRRDYMTRLSNLTVNSRPIIQTLSLIAQDYSRYADVVVQCIEQHLRRVSHRLHDLFCLSLPSRTRRSIEPAVRSSISS